MGACEAALGPFSPPHVAVILEKMLHMRIRRLSDPLARALLLLLWLGRLLCDLPRVRRSGFLPDAEQLPVHVVDRR